MSKTVLLAINAKYVHSSLAVWFLAESVSYSRLRHDVRVVEATTKQNSGDIAGQIAVHMPDVVGISTYIWNASMLPDLLGLLKEQLPDAVLVLGGPEASYNAEYWLTQGADYILRGEGERGFPALLDAIAGNDVAALESIPGLCSNKNGKTHINLNAGQTDNLIDPYSESYFEALKGRISYIETSRGCPFQCTFCLSGGSGVRFFPLETAKEQIYRLSNSGTKTIKFVDRTFNCNAERAYELFKYVISLKTSCCFHFEVAADLFDERTLSLLSTAPHGRIQLEAGLQSFCEPALKATSRLTNPEKAEKNIKILLSAQNIHIHVDLIAGLPYETLSDFQDSFDRAYALGAHTLQLGFLKLLHGSKLREQAEALGILYDKNPPYKIISSPWLSSEDLKILEQAENALQHTHNRGRFLSASRYALSVSGLTPFSLYCALGEIAPNHAVFLEVYAEQVYDFYRGLPNVDENILRDYMVCDWLSMVKGKNMPQFLKNYDRRRKKVAVAAEKMLNRVIDYDETAVLSSGKGVFIDSVNRNPVTGLYQLHFINYSE